MGLEEEQLEEQAMAIHREPIVVAVVVAAPLQVVVPSTNPIPMEWTLMDQVAREEVVACQGLTHPLELVWAEVLEGKEEVLEVQEEER